MEEIKKKQSVSISEVKALLKEQDPETMAVSYTHLTLPTKA